MYLDYSKLEFDAEGRPEVPEIILQTLGRDVIGILPSTTNLKMNIKFSEPSEISFDIPALIDGEPNPFYSLVTGHKILYTKHYGIYQTMNPKTSGDGISEVKSVSGYSLEKTLESKKFFLEEGTFNFWNPAAPDDTVIGRILEIATDWSVGYISPSLIGRYRTFDSYDDYLLNFIYNHAPDKFRCVFVFDPYQMTINAYDADEERPILPIYLDYDNLVESIEIEEVSDELVTAIRPYGADSLDIRAVNPIGTNWMYDISYFIANGDIPSSLARKWENWQKSILNNRTHYEGLVGLRSSATARILTEQAALTDLNGELDNLINQQSVTIQALSLETTAAGKSSQQKVLDEINEKISAKKNEISEKEALINSIQEESEGDGPESYKSQITAIVSSLAINNYFTKEELSVLSRYFIEQDLTEETFVASDIDASISGNSYTLGNDAIAVTGSSITKIDMTDGFGKTMYVLTGGTITIDGGKSIEADIIRGTIEVANDGSFVMGNYVGKITVNDKSASSGTLTLAGTLTNIASDIKPVTEQEVTTYEGTYIRFNATSGSLYLTANVSEYQKYSVQMELYDYAAGVLRDLATPTYEFSVDSGNFLFSNEFKAFRDKLELGSGIYLNIGDKQLITPLIIEFELDFEELNKFSIVFSNRFKRHDNVNTLKDMIESSYSSSRDFDASKYIYNQSVSQASKASKFMSDSLNAAVNTIVGAANQSVVINGAGIQIGGDSKYKMRIVDSMIAMTDDDWKTAKMAIGRFASPEIGEYWGINSEVLGGKILIGNNLIMENQNDYGVTQFRFDSSGAWLYNSTFVLAADSIARTSGGKILLDPRYGIIAGSGDIFSTSGTTVYPSFIDDDGDIVLDDENMPKNSNFYLDIRDGNAYFRGRITATSGKIGGFTIESDYLYAGSGNNYVALNGSGTNTNSSYAIWAGATSPTSAKFSVKKDGTLYAKDGTFGGTLSAARVSGALKAADGNSWIEGLGITVNNGVFMVDQAGNVTMNGNLTLKNGAITWANLNSSVTSKITEAQEAADAAYDEALSASSDAYYAERLARRIANGEFSGGTFINGQEIYSPTIYADEFVVKPETKGGSNWTGGYSLYGYFGSTMYHMLKISYADTGFSPEVEFWSPAGAYAYWGFGRTTLSGYLDFSSATVEGLYAQFG